jgi:hypothetical protein
MEQVTQKGVRPGRAALLIACVLALSSAAPVAANESGPGRSPADDTRKADVSRAGDPAADLAVGQAVEQAPEPAAERVPDSNFKWAWGNTITYGLGVRTQGRDKRIIGIAAGGTGWSVNGDDGNQNYDTGIFTNAIKITSELQISYKNVGGFVRGFGFVDFENEYGDRARTELTGSAKRRVGSRAEIRDAFGYVRGSAGELRVGWQVINWGESTFIQGGINAINPLDVSVLRVPGAELRDALLPVGAVKVSLKPFKDLTFEGFYQYTWEDLKIDPVGSYFSTTDLAGAGAQKVMLGFGSAPDTIPVGHPPLPPTFSPVGVAVPKVDAEEPSDQGQWGAAIRYFAEGLGGTEFGLYFVNYHSRLPLIMANTGTANGILVTRNYAATASYFLTYPEDIKLFGASFNAQLGRTGIALQGEVSHRRDLPLQMDDVELLYAALTPLRLLPPVPQLAPLIGLGTLLANTNQVGAYGFSQQIQGYERFDTTQVQTTATKAFSQVLGADQFVLVGEIGWGHVHDMPDQSVLRLEAPGTYVTGNQVHQTAGIQPGTEPASAFATADAWGYVLAGRLEYNGVVGAVNMTPRFSFSQDVSGISPGPGGNFLEGRKALTVGLGFQYRISWEFDLSYNSFFGAGRYNLINDRDFVAANIKYSF